MRVHDILENTVVNGPGNRICVWLQGCRRDCAGCFNQAARSIDGGMEMSVEDLMLRISAGNYDGVSFSGGEPFLQYAELKQLSMRIREAGMNVFVFTGFTYDEIRDNPEMRDVLEYVDYLADGPYIREIPSKCSLTGSGNQRVLRLERGEIAEDMTNVFSDGSVMSEIIIGGDGKITITGFDSIGE